MSSFFSDSILHVRPMSQINWDVMVLPAVLASFGYLVREHETPSESEPCWGRRLSGLR